MTELEKCMFWCEMIKVKAAEITEEWRQQRDELEKTLRKEEKDEIATSEA